VAQALFALFYDYVPDMLERRAPYRDAHLGLLRDLHGQGVVVMAGATGDPVDGALIVFRSATEQAVRDFIADDPFGAAGLVVSARIVPWAVSVP
jgi:uncharacterized protein YciI